MKISFSQVRLYGECGKKYQLRYKNGYYEKYQSSALSFGSAIDAALNSLLEERDETKALAAFYKAWDFGRVGASSDLQPLQKNERLVYAESDFDADLLTEEDVALIGQDWLQRYKSIQDDKKDRGWDNLTSQQRQYYNYVNWLCLRRKGPILISSYAEKVLPKIKKVLAVQAKRELSNGEDSIDMYLDLVAEMEDGKRYLLDNKTAARPYEPDAAARSPQLILYYHAVKDEFKLDGVGFIVMAKNISKNKIKTCSVCTHDGTESRAKTCDNVVNGKRCSGEWMIDIDPECRIDVLLSKVSERAEDIVMENFDEVNNAIKSNVFTRNMGSCVTGYGKCPYYGICWHNDFSNVETKE